MSEEAASSCQLFNYILSSVYSIVLTRHKVFGSSKLPPWVERGGVVDSIGKLLIRTRWGRGLNREIIDNFLLRTEEDVIHNIRPRYYNPTRSGNY